jgi:uncharacterized protein (TIGR02145 family)
MRKLFLFLSLSYIFYSCNPNNPSPNCTFTYSSWSACASGTQTRTYTVSPSGCAGTPPPDSLTRVCTSIVSNPGNGVTFDGVTYSSIVLGNGQEWMGENLTTTKYANGDPVTMVWSSGSPSWADVNGQETAAFFNVGSSGEKLYNFYAVVDPRNLCPTGWHIPSDTEWTLLTDYLGGENTAGGKMKVTGIGGYPKWSPPNQDATNEIGFSALPAGFIQGNGVFLPSDCGGYWWSSTEPIDNGGETAWYRVASCSHGMLGRASISKSNGYSVRCVKD